MIVTYIIVQEATKIVLIDLKVATDVPPAITALIQGTTTIPKPNVVFTHHPCPDGLSCRIILKEMFSNHVMEFRDYQHGLTKITVDDVKNKIVWSLDKCPSLEECEIINQYGKDGCYIIDHHDDKTTQLIYPLVLSHKWPKIKMLPVPKPNVICGSLMLFHFLNNNNNNIVVPYWLDSINKGDTDLITKRTEDEKAYHAALTDNLDPIVFGNFIQKYGLLSNHSNAILIGKEIIAKRQAIVNEALTKQYMKLVTIEQTQYSVVYIPVPDPRFISLVADTFWLTKNNNHLCNFNSMILAIQWVSPKDNVQNISLRVHPSSLINVAQIASFYKGGGHPKAAGIQHLKELHDIPSKSN